MPPPGASAPAFAATVKPARARPHANHPRQDASSTRDGTRAGGCAEDVLGERAKDGLLRASILDFKLRLANRCKLFPDYTLLHASILDFGPKLANRCRDFPVYPIFRALILNFKPKLANRCRVFPVSAIFRASILDFRSRLGNRCKLFPVYPLFRALILDFRPRFANHCSTIVAAVWNGLPATAVAATIFRIRFKFLCSKEEWPACSVHGGNDLPRPILISVEAKKNGSAYSGRSGNKFRVRFCSSLPQRRMARRLQHRCYTEEWPAGYAIAAARKNGPPVE